MSVQNMYPPSINSPMTLLTEDIDNTTTILKLEDASVLPDPPNLCTIGNIDPETVIYTGKNGNDLTGLVRGFEGAAKSWSKSTKAGRVLTAYDLSSLQSYVEQLSEEEGVNANEALFESIGSLVIGGGGTNFLNTTGDEGYYNTLIGIHAGEDLTTGYKNTVVGSNSLYSNTTGYYNTSNGYGSLYSNTTGNYNTSNGAYSLYYNTTGYYNTSNGYCSLYYNTTGEYNTSNGYNSLRFNTIGNYNTSNGYNSLCSNTTGNSNTSNGYNSGRYIADGVTGRTTGDYGLYLGYNSKASADGTSNEIVIGYNAIGNGSNTVTLGNTSITKTILEGNIGIGTQWPTSQIHINAAKRNHIFFSSTASAQDKIAGFFSNTDMRWEIGPTNKQVDDAGPKLLIIGEKYPTFGNNYPDSIHLITGDTKRLSINSIGNIGIGTTDPTEKLDVIGSIALSGIKLISSPNSTSIVYGTGGANMTESYNTLIGIETGNSLTSGMKNTANGCQAGYSNTTGAAWTANGYQAGYSNTTGGAWTANGYRAGFNNTTGGVWTANGYAAGYSNTTSSAWTANGYQAGFNNTTGGAWTANGYAAGYSNTTSSYWTANGCQAGYSNTTSSYWTANGCQAGYSNTTGAAWTANGYQAGFNNTTGSNWTANGYQAGHYNITGSNWTANGYKAGFNNTTCSNWTADGYQAGYSNTTGGAWTANGYQAGFNNTTGGAWTANGYAAGYNNTTGSNWTSNGYAAGRYLADGATGAKVFNNSTYIGANTKVSAEDVTNENVFGYNAIGSGSNSVTLGDDNITKTILKGNVGIGTTPPTASLHIKAGTTIAGTAPVKFSTGDLLAVPESGTIEFDGEDFYLTI